MRKIELIIDTDIGTDIDDTWALAFALKEPRFAIRLISVTCGDTDYKLELVAKLLQSLGRTDIPVVRGVGGGETIYPQKRYVTGFRLAGYEGVVLDDVAVAYEKALAGAENARVIGLAPNTTLCGLTELFKSRKTPVVAMAGSVRKGYFGSPYPVPECNVVSDLAASRKVFAAGLDYTMLPLDVCGDWRIDGEAYRQIAASQAPAARAVMENYLIWDADYAGGAKKYDTRLSSTILYDLAPFFYLLFPENFSVRRLCVSVDENGLMREGRGDRCRAALGVKNVAQMTAYAVKRLTEERTDA